MYCPELFNVDLASLTRKGSDHSPLEVTKYLCNFFQSGYTLDHGFIITDIRFL